MTVSVDRSELTISGLFDARLITPWWLVEVEVYPSNEIAGISLITDNHWFRIGNEQWEVTPNQLIIKTRDDQGQLVEMVSKILELLPHNRIHKLTHQTYLSGETDDLGVPLPDLYPDDGPLKDGHIHDFGFHMSTELDGALHTLAIDVYDHESVIASLTTSRAFLCNSKEAQLAACRKFRGATQFAIDTIQHYIFKKPDTPHV